MVDHQPQPPRRLNLLLSYSGWRQSDALSQLAKLLAPRGIDCFTADTGEEATEVIQRMAVHIAVIDWGIPLRGTTTDAPPAGGRILSLLRRAEPTPPTIIVRPPQATARESARGLSDALREGAFAVVDRPVQLETLLEVMRRAVRRHYADHWPAA